VAFVIVAANRKPAANDTESAALLKTLLVYTGKFAIDGDKFTTKVDISGNEQSWPRKSGQDAKWSFCLTAGTLCPANQERP
jgi:hypothetical protein